nr:PREDICTED: pectin acetylesterase 8-like [Nicotiana tabacum]
MAAIYAVLFVCVLSLCRTEALQTLLVNLTILESAVEKGAVCLDGSAPAFLFHRGTGFQYWLIHLEVNYCPSNIFIFQFFYFNYSHLKL